MSRAKQQFYIAPIVHTQVIGPLTAEEIRTRFEDAETDENTFTVFVGKQLPVVRRTVVDIGEPSKRRGRPPGSKNKPKLEVETAPVPVPEPVGKKTKKPRVKETQAERNTRLEAE